MTNRNAADTAVDTTPPTALNASKLDRALAVQAIRIAAISTTAEWPSAK